jgi:hypothetical protein
MNRTIFFPEQRQGYALAPQFGMQICPVRFRAGAVRVSDPTRIKALFKHRIRQVIRQRPDQTRGAGSP